MGGLRANAASRALLLRGARSVQALFANCSTLERQRNERVPRGGLSLQADAGRVDCDVRGGYPEAQSGLSKFASEWMVREAAAAGLLVDRKEWMKLWDERGRNSQRP
jgi:hypothetical protein